MSDFFGFVVSRDPYSSPAGREQLDPALAAATLNLPVKVFFVGDGVLHLVPGQQAQSLPAAPFSRGWGALETLSERVHLFAESTAVGRICKDPQKLTTVAEILDCEMLALEMHDCKVIFHV